MVELGYIKKEGCIKMQNFLNTLTNKNILITGGLGFIGSNLAIRLTKIKCNITIVDSLRKSCGGNIFNIEPVKNKIELHRVDLLNKKIDSIVKNKHFIFNLAGHVSHRGSMLHPKEDKSINVDAQKCLLEACRKNNTNVKIIYTGTRGQYGKAKELPVKETHKMRPLDVNGTNKQIAEEMHLEYCRLYGIMSCCLRLTNVYGPRHQMKNPDQGFLGWFIRLALEDKDITIYADGSQLRDFIYVKDVNEALLQIMANDKTNGEVYNLATEKPISVLKAAETIIKIAGSGRIKKVPFPDNKKKIEIGDFYADISKIKRVINWEPKISFEEGIKQTIEFYKKNRAHYF